jgi:Uma2 family endonuclease
MRRGVFKQNAAPKGKHGSLQLWLGQLIQSFALALKLATAFTETRVTFGGSSLVPDLTVYRWGRIPRDSNGQVADDHVIPPDIAVEIVSRGQSISGLRERSCWYVDHGVEIALLIHPSQEWVELLRAGQQAAHLTNEDPTDLETVLPGFQLTPQRLFEALWLQ